MADPAAPTLPISNRSKNKDAGGRSPKKGGASSTNKGTSRHKAWADFTPTPWGMAGMPDYAATPWTNRGGMPGAMMPPFDPAAMMAASSAWKPQDTPMDAAWPSTPTPASWGSTPTPANNGLIPQMPFGLGGLPPPMPMVGMPMMMPQSFAAMAMAAANAAAVAAAAAGAAGAPGGAVPSYLAAPSRSTEGSPEAARIPEQKSKTPAKLGMVQTYIEETYDESEWDEPISTGMAINPAGPPPESTMPVDNLASKGSALHGTGKCRPCAWFWKPQGCSCATECSYCHMCPEGELKARKKDKVAAMRMGALTPAKPGNSNPGAARRLKLTSLL